MHGEMDERFTWGAFTGEPINTRVCYRQPTLVCFSTTVVVLKFFNRNCTLALAWEAP